MASSVKLISDIQDNLSNCSKEENNLIPFNLKSHLVLLLKFCNIIDILSFPACNIHIQPLCTGCVLILNSLCLQIFDLFDVKKKGVIDFGDFVRSLDVFHPNAPLEDKIDCKSEDEIFKSRGCSLLLLCDPTILMDYVRNFLSVSFRLYDLDSTGYIERHEVGNQVVICIKCKYLRKQLKYSYWIQCI